MTEWDGSKTQPAAHQYHGKTHSCECVCVCVWGCVCVQCLSASNEDVSSNLVYQHIPTLLSISANICPFFSIYLPNPTSFLRSVCLPHSLSLFFFTVAPHNGQTFLLFHFPAAFVPTHQLPIFSPSLHLLTNIFLSLISCFIPSSLFSPCDLAQIASRCCCDSFAYTSITAKKTMERIFITHYMARSGWTDWLMMLLSFRILKIVSYGE